MHKDRSWLYLSLLTLLVAIVWTAVTAISSTRKSTIPSDVETVMAPLDPKIDQSIFTILQQKSK